LTYTVTAVPSSVLGNIVLADGTTVVTVNTAYSLAQLQSMQFKPAANGNGGIATFAWTVQDDGGTARGGADALTESLAITVTAVSHTPASVAVPGAQISTSIGLTFSAASHNAITVAGAADLGPIVVTIQATNGIVTLGSWSGITFIQGYGVGDQLLTISGTADQLNAALNGLYYRASAMYGGISIQVTDANGSSALADVPITQAPLVDYGASIASTDVSTFTTTQGVQATPAVGATTAASAASEMAAGTATPGIILSASTSDVSPIPTTAAGTVFSSTATYTETAATLTSENEAPASYRLKSGRPDNAFRNEPPPAVRPGEDLKFDLEVRSSEQSQTPATKVDDETLVAIERDPAEAATEQTTAEVVESAILVLTSGFLSYSLAFDQVLRNRVQDILEASSRNGDQPF